MLENVHFGLVNEIPYLEHYWTEFHRTFNVDAFWDKDERLRFGVRTQKVVVGPTCDQHSKTKKNTGHITKLGRWIAHDNSWSPILFEVKRSNVMVGVSLHSSECQSSGCNSKETYWAC